MSTIFNSSSFGSTGLVTQSQLTTATNACIKKQQLTTTGASSGVVQVDGTGTINGQNLYLSALVNGQNGQQRFRVNGQSGQVQTGYNTLDDGAGNINTYGDITIGGNRSLYLSGSGGIVTGDGGLQCVGPLFMNNNNGDANITQQGSTHISTGTGGITCNGNLTMGANNITQTGSASISTPELITNTINGGRLMVVGLNQIDPPIIYGDSTTQFLTVGGANSVNSCLTVVKSGHLTTYLGTDDNSNAYLGVDGTQSINFQTGKNVFDTNIGSSGTTQLQITYNSGINCNTYLTMGSNNIIQSGTGSITAGTGGVTTTGEVVGHRFRSNGSTPSVVPANGTASLAAGSTDNGGTMLLNLTTSVGGNVVVATLTYATPYPTAAFPLVSYPWFVTSSSNTGFVVASQQGAGTGAQQITYNVMGS